MHACVSEQVWNCAALVHPLEDGEGRRAPTRRRPGFWPSRRAYLLAVSTLIPLSTGALCCMGREAGPAA
eukprot:366329-Chlamydomonas_euryale.AAC.6